MIRNISIGIDIGSYVTKVVVGEFIKGEKNPKIIGMGESFTLGVRHGYVVNFAETVSSLKKAIKEAENASGIKVKRAFIGVGTVTLQGLIATGVTIVSKADGEITNLDITKALEEAESNITSNNKKIIQVSPISFKLDGKEIQGRPEGMHGNKLEVKALFSTCSNQHLEDLLEVVTSAGVEPIDVIPSPVAASSIALSEKQKIVGCALVNIGSETMSMSVFENNALISLHTYSIGSSDFTNDVALGLKITLEEAENLKLKNSSANFSKKKLDEIIEARLSDVLEIVDSHLKKIKRNELLPAGIIWIGGGANLEKLEELSKSTLMLPSRIGNDDFFGNAKTKLRDPAWFTALGLIIYDKIDIKNSRGSFFGIFQDMKNTIKSITKQFLP